MDWITLLMFFLPVLLTGTGIAVGQHKYKQWRQNQFLLTKNMLSSRLIAADEKVNFLEAASDDAFTKKRAVEARAHLNAAFASYSQGFSGDHYLSTPFKSVSYNVGQQLDLVDRQLTAAASDPGSVERLKVVGADFGREIASVAVPALTRMISSGASELNRIVAQGQLSVGQQPTGVLAQGQVHGSGALAKARPFGDVLAQGVPGPGARVDGGRVDGGKLAGANVASAKPTGKGPESDPRFKDL